jgi:Peptidase family M23
MRRNQTLSKRACAAASAMVGLWMMSPALHAEDTTVKTTRVYAMMQGLPGQTSTRTWRGEPTPGELCFGESGGDHAGVIPVLCALPHARERPTVGGTQPGTTPGFAYHPPGDLDPRDPGKGRADDRLVYAPNIIFPLRLAPGQDAHMNSQTWGNAGTGWAGKGEAGGSECDPVNYDAMQQRDTYCEVRNWDMPMCPGGSGHPGQDIRPPTCKDNIWEAVAVVDGVITAVTANTTVRLHGSDGSDYFYLHMHPQSIAVTAGQAVKQGDVLGRVSKYFGGEPDGTTTHLHFRVRQTIRADGQVLSVYVPVYTSLIVAYRKAKGLDPGIGPDGSLAVDAKLELAPTTATIQQPSTSTPPVQQQTTPPAQQQTTPTAPGEQHTNATPPVQQQTTSTTPVQQQTTSTPPAQQQTTSTAPAEQQTTATPSVQQQTTSTAPGQQQTTSPAQQQSTSTPSAQATAQSQSTTVPSPASQQAPQNWWQKAVDGVKNWWNKPTK